MYFNCRVCKAVKMQVMLTHVRICTLTVNNDDVNNDDIRLYIYKLYFMWYSIQNIFIYAVISAVGDYLKCKNENKTRCFSQTIICVQCSNVLSHIHSVLSQYTTLIQTEMLY